MFESFSKGTTDAATKKRMAASTGAAMVAYVALGGGVLVLAGSKAQVQEDKLVEVTFDKPVAPKKVDLPPPPPPKKVRVKQPVGIQAPPPPQQLLAPVEIPQEKPKEADPNAKLAMADHYGTTGAIVGSPGGTAAPEPEPPPPPPPPKNQPVQLPEEAEPAMPDEDNQSPAFPEAMRAAGKEGLVILKIVIKADGSVGDIQVMKGEEPFISAALAVVKGWKYTPAMLDGTPLTTFKIVRIPFKLSVG